MGFDYRTKLTAEGQQHSNACWAASISWWTAAMGLHYKRKYYSQTDLLADFQEHVVLGGSVRTDGIRKIVESAKIRMDLKYISPAALKAEYAVDTPCLIIYNYPAAGGTHMNVIFDRQGDTVMCMEPFYPLAAARDGSRKGTYVRRPMSFFANSQEVGLACLPYKDMVGVTGD